MSWHQKKVLVETHSSPVGYDQNLSYEYQYGVIFAFKYSLKIEPSCIPKDLSLGLRASNQRKIYILSLGIVSSNWIFSIGLLKIIKEKAISEYILYRA